MKSLLVETSFRSTTTPLRVICISCADRQGSELLNKAITTAPGKKIVFGYSLGAHVSEYWIDHYGPTSAVPPSDLSFVLIGSNYGDKNGGDMATRYKVTTILRQYDAFADTPNNWSSPNIGLAWQNASQGGYLHNQMETVSLLDPKNVVTTIGNVTYVYVPTDIVPLARSAGSNAQARDNELRPLIESAYKRPVVIPDPTP